ncbi:hypothetical protein SAMN02910358_01168 [Lachnospiraceae bacterium XBB1006]|nr:hypothetical protein SAMN02910358_01168 [Lachnospiraceae bacterium XBB1006]
MVENKFFNEVNGNFGFGCMRLPMNGDEVDNDEFCKMIDAFIEAGFNYFDTAHGYINGKSELAIGKCLSERYDRSKFLLANKLTAPYFDKKEDIRPFFENQLKWCKVDYFDFYLMHAQGKGNYPKFQECKAYETAYELKQEGKIKHLGLSFHDRPEVLEQILRDHPEVEFVQIQFNYVDYENPSVESRAVYEVCKKYKKPVIVMEPVKGGSLVHLPEKASIILKQLESGSNANIAIRFSASFPQMAVVLSGMSDWKQMQDNLKAMKDFKPLSEQEMEAVAKVQNIVNELNAVPCTACSYCVEENHCPKQIRIPDMFEALNNYKVFNNEKMVGYYNNMLIKDGHGKASECIACGQCEAVCPQHLQIRAHLQTVAETFE